MRRLLPASVACLALLAGMASASSGSQPTGQIVFGMNHFCQSPAPNGGGTVPVECGKGEIAVVKANGSGVRVLTHDKVTETSPAWSPNHEQIAFIRPKAGKSTSDQIWVMNADGSHQHALTHLTTAPELWGNPLTSDLSWSPDGQEIVFAAWPNSQGGQEQLFVVSVRTHGVRRLANLPYGATEPAWSPNGRWIAFVAALGAPGRIYLLSTKTHTAHAVGRAKGLCIGWSPDSKRLVLNAGGKLELVNTAGTHYHSLGVDGNQPSFSPDGRWIVFPSGDYLKEIRPDGSGLHHILYVTSKKGSNFEPNW